MHTVLHFTFLHVTPQSNTETALPFPWLCSIPLHGHAIICSTSFLFIWIGSNNLQLQKEATISKLDHNCSCICGGVSSRQLFRKEIIWSRADTAVLLDNSTFSCVSASNIQRVYFSTVIWTECVLPYPHFFQKIGKNNVSVSFNLPFCLWLRLSVFSYVEQSFIIARMRAVMSHSLRPHGL